MTSIAQDAFASSRETQMPYADCPTPLDQYAARVREARCQYRRDCALLSEVSAYARLKSEQQRAMRELVTGEYWRMIAVRDAPHKGPIMFDTLALPKTGAVLAPVEQCASAEQNCRRA
jgi:hypothetical protein